MKEIKQRLQEVYGLEATSIEALVGEVNRNYLVDSDRGPFIYKETPADKKTAGFTLEETHLLSVLATDFPGCFQDPLAGLDGRMIYDAPDGSFQFRLLTYLEGDLLNGIPHTRKLFHSFGALLAKMDRRLQEEECSRIRSRRYDWDNLHFDLSIGHRDCIENPTDRKLVDYFHLQFHEQVLPRLPELRFSLIHNDANDYNVVVRNGEVKGLIDLGDCVYSLLINELAIALSYILMDKEDPLEEVIPMIQGYCEVLPLTELEVDLLYYLVGTRLSISLLHSSLGRGQHPENQYLLISQAPVIRLLHQWISIGPIATSRAFRRAASLSEPAPVDIPAELRERDRHLSGALSISFREPLHMEASAFQYMYDSMGRSFLDLRNNIPHVGHAHPKVVRAGQKAMARLNTNTRYLYEGIHQYSEKLLGYFPDQLNKVFYVNSGSAATDLALRLARTHTGKQKMLVMAHAYHGNTRAAIEVSHYKFSGKGGEGTPGDTLVTPIPLCGLSLSPEEIRARNQEQIQDFLHGIGAERGHIAGFITEPIVSAAGQVVIDASYTRAITDFIREQGGLYIADEVQTGFGRLGSYFWGFELSEVVPDIVILGKPIANGHPMAAVVCTEEVARSFENGMEFFSSFGGNPVSCAIGEALLDVMEEEGMQKNAEEVGSFLIDGLEGMRSEFPLIGEIRGSGLSLGFELLDQALAARLVEDFKEQGILAGTDGPLDNVFKLKPPLCFSKENAEHFLGVLRELLARV